MKMMICERFQKRDSYPGYFNEVCEMLEMADHRAYANRNEIDLFVIQLRQTLEKNIPEGNPAHVHHYRGAGEVGRITICSGNDHDFVASLEYCPIRDFLRWSPLYRCFVNVSHLYEIGGM